MRTQTAAELANTRCYSCLRDVDLESQVFEPKSECVFHSSCLNEWVKERIAHLTNPELEPNSAPKYSVVHISKAPEVGSTGQQ